MGLNFRLSFLFSSLLLRRRLNFYHPPASIITILIEEVTTSAMNDGLVNGALTFLPSLAGLYLALKNKKFRQVRCLFTPHNCDVYPPRPSPAVFYYIERENEGGWPVVDSVVADTPRCSSFDPAFGSSTPESMSSVTGERYKMFMKLTECGLYVSLLCGILLHLFFFMECLTLFLFFISVFTPSRRLCYLSYNNQHTHQKIFKINNELHKVTNGQSRTAIAIMPPLFVFAVTSEQKLTHRMHEVASENEHTIEVRAEQ